MKPARNRGPHSGPYVLTRRLWEMEWLGYSGLRGEAKLILSMYFTG